VQASFDAVVIGSGPNGLAAAIELARAGASVIVFEAEHVAGGGARSLELTLPGFRHDVCSAIHPLALSSRFFRSVPLAEHGLEWVQPPIPLAHPLDDGMAIALHRSVDDTARGLGPDREAYCNLMGPLLEAGESLRDSLLAPLRVPALTLPLIRFGLLALRSGRSMAESVFDGERARALLAGLTAHSMLELNKPVSAAFALVLGLLAHAVGWPVARGGSQKIADALISYLRSLGGEVVTGRRIASVDELPPARAVLCDITPRQLLDIAGHRLPPEYRRVLRRYRYGLGAYKVDWALDGPIPWTAAECTRAGTVHLGGTLEEIEASEAAAWHGRRSDNPFVLLAQPSLFDPSRAPAGKHVGWAYCHVPNGAAFDMTSAIEDQVERFAPGFRERILARSVLTPLQMEQHNSNLVGGDINGGVQDLGQLFVRPSVLHYRTPARSLYICSASTPPGGGVHGLCGYFAAHAALKRSFGRS
jgi:phytoene dehydrogenase-like protein